MAYDDLRDWIAALDRAGELKRIRTEVDPILEITEITDRVSKMPVGRATPGRVLPAAPRSCFKTSKAIPVHRFSSTSSAPPAA